MSIQAYVMINLSKRDPKQVCADLKDPDVVKSGIVKTVHIVTGPYDIIAVVEAENIEKLSHLITQEIHPIEGIERTFSCIVLV